MSSSQDKRDPIEIWADEIESLRYESLPRDVVEVTKKSILDTLGVCIAASTAVPACRQVAEMVKEMGGKQECSLLAFGGKAPAAMAALANGALGHALDYDDGHYGAYMRVGGNVVPAALAMAQRKGSVGGKELIAAVTLGQEIMIGTSLAITRGPRGWKNDWYMGSVTGGFGATAAACRILGHDREKAADALGIAAFRAGGTMEVAFGTGSDLRGIYMGFTSMTGVLAALMAGRGITGVRSGLEGKAGILSTYFQGLYDRDTLVRGKNAKFVSLGMDFKPWPACGWVHTYIDATVDIVNTHDIAPQDIDRITVYVGDSCRNLCYPLEMRRFPKSTLDAKFSIPFCVAAAAIRRKLVIGDVTPHGITDTAVLAMADKVFPEFDASLEAASGDGMSPGVVEIRTKAGAVHTRRRDIPLGDYRNPIGMADVVAKFRDCVRHSAMPLDPSKVDRVIEMVAHLEDVQDSGQIAELLS